ncbi:hypothetical protein [Sphingomonas sp.]|uniref:hypothetical protein n=1 Tax=Sphingomonas sp. TaxID=28214 RepID=UPI002DD662CA|nr:hypothetical protein [Sphingomonas sp.]
MDLSFARFPSGRITALPVELAIVLVGVASRQAASPTARVQAAIDRIACTGRRLAPADGCFDGATASALTRWKAE